MKVLISRTDRLGDLILSLPVADVLKERGYEVYYLLNSYTAPLISGHPAVDGYVLFKDFTKTLKVLKKLKLDTVIALFSTPKLALLFKLAGIKRRIGLFYRYYSIFFTDRIKIRRSKTDLHEVEINLKFLEPLGIQSEVRKPLLFLRKEEIERGRKLLSGLKRPVITIHPQSFGSAPNWPPDKYRELISRLASEGLSVVITGARREEIPYKNTLNLTGKTNLRELMAVIKASDLFISGSTGPMHIAAALGTPTVSIFSTKRPFFPERWRPLHERSIVIAKEDPNLIEVEEVLSEVKLALGGN